MNDIQMKVSEILSDKNHVKRLLMLEKKRRGMQKDALVFVGMADVAQQWWCTQQAVLKSRAMEPNVFGAYLSDRILYANRLGLITKLPKSQKALLDIGSEITSNDVEELLKEEKEKEDDLKRRFAGAQSQWIYRDTEHGDGNRVRLINPDLPPEEKHGWELDAAHEGVKIIDIEQDPKLRGRIYQASRAEKYPTIRWHFPWRHYSVGGVPDGLTEDFAYEYKTTGSPFLFRFMKPMAIAQADLYGYFFHRPKKRVQIEIIQDNSKVTFEEPVDAANAEATLDAFARVDAGEPARPPKPWKCPICEFRTTCPISQAK
jgi:hypothetical protein